MHTKVKSTFIKVALIASKSFQLPHALSFIIQIINSVQIFSLVISDFMLSKHKEDDYFSKNITFIFSNLKSMTMLSQMESEIEIRIVAYSFYLYIFFKLFLLFYSAFWIYRGKDIMPQISKLLGFIVLMHSQIIFYPIHSFFLRMINLYLDCDETFDFPFYCQKEWIVLPTLFGLFNLLLGCFKEIYWYRILNQRKAYAIKDNLYPLLIFAQKAMIVPLLYYLDNQEIVVAILNLLLSSLNLYILQSHLPFYKMKMLRREIGFSGIICFFSLLVVVQSFSDLNHILVVMLLVIPLAIKFNLLLLEISFQKMLKKLPQNPLKAAHLPILIKSYLKNPQNINEDIKRISSESILLSGFIKHHYNNPIHKESQKDEKTQAYLMAIEKLESLLKLCPNNVFLLIYMAQIYIEKMKNVQKALYFLKRIKAERLSIPMKNSLETLYLELEGMYSTAATHDPKKKLIYLNYFENRDRTRKLKMMIQEEIVHQARFWEGLNVNPVDGYKIITRTEAINKIQDRIESYWQNDIQSCKDECANACLLYGLYLETVQDRPHLGSFLVQKAYKLILNKRSLHEDIINISTGKSAIVIASTEPEDAGKIVDASSSVKILFEIERKQLIGSNVNVMLPKVMTHKHTKLIQNFHHEYQQKDLNSRFYSYAKSVKDKYFPVEIQLSYLPSFKNGLNIVACINKKSNSESIMIIDYYGKLLECSKDIQNLLKIGNIGEYLDWSQICPEMIQANHAFNILYSSETEAKINNQESSENNLVLNAVSKLLGNKSSTSVLHNSTEDFSSQRMLISKNNHQENFVEENLSNNRKRAKDLPSSFKSKRRPKFSFEISRGEAEDICNEFREKKRLKFFFPQNLSKSKLSKEILLDVQVEPLIFAGTLYKIVKVFKISDIENESLCSSVRLEPERKYIACNPQKEKAEKVTNKESGIENKDSIGDDKKDPSNKDFGNLKNPTRGSIGKSGVNSIQSTANEQAKHLNNLSTKQKISYATRRAIIVVFLSILVLVTSVCVKLILTRRSLDEMNRAIDLINLTNIRLFKLIAAWRGEVIVYSRAVALRTDTSPSMMVRYRQVIKDCSADMLKNNNMLRKLVDELSDEFITQRFFEKKISLWLPYESATVNGEKVDLFTANQIISNKNIDVANYPPPASILKNKSEAIFSLNNTANDYLLAVSESISDVRYFSDQTHYNNINLLKMLLVFENLALIISLISLLVLMKIIFTKQKNLFNAISKINEEKIEQKFYKLRKLANYLKEDIEDSVIFFKDDQSKIVKKSNVKHHEKKKDASYSRQYSLKGLVLNMYKHLLLTFLVMAFIMGVFWFSIRSSIQGFDELSRISSQIVTVYELGGRISLILSEFYYVLIFFGQPLLKIRNDSPANQMKLSIEILNQANEKLLAALSIPEKGIEDPIIEELLNKNVCQYITPENKVNCDRVTNYNSIGLLGANSKFYQACGLPILYYLSNATATNGQKLLDNIVTVLGDMYYVCYDGYGALANILLNNFKRKIQEKEENTLAFFKSNLILIMILMLLIKQTVIEKYKNIDLAVKKIIILIPYGIVEKNKVIMNYLSKTFSKDLHNTR